ncbi:MAG: hypothetical protein ACLQFI_02330 [Methylocella sp.]
MKTDSERQTEYQRRRRETEERITVWVSKEVEHGMDVLRGKESRTDWINRAVTELTLRQLLQKPFPFTDEELKEAGRLGRERGINISE